MTAPAPETRPLAHGLAAVLIPHGLTAEQERALHERLGLACRHDARARHRHPASTARRRPVAPRPPHEDHTEESA